MKYSYSLEFSFGPEDLRKYGPYGARIRTIQRVSSLSGGRPLSSSDGGCSRNLSIRNLAVTLTGAAAAILLPGGFASGLTPYRWLHLEHDVNSALEEGSG